jgi:hypothetical protein
MSYFSTVFKKQLTPKSTYKYIFTSHIPLKNESERIPFSILSVQAPYDAIENGELPDEFENPIRLKAVFDQWLLDCSGCFVKSPTFEKFKYESQVISSSYEIHDNLPVSHLYPVRIELDMPTFKIFWAISHRTSETPTARDDKIMIDEDEPELQPEDHTYIQQPDGTRFITTKDGVRSEWLQELNDASLPLSDSPALRLEVDHDEVQREKFRRRVREARIRAKLARYRAERLAQRYEERFGLYPDEDAEEAQTEAEQSDDE